MSKRFQLHFMRTPLVTLCGIACFTTAVCAEEPGLPVIRSHEVALGMDSGIARNDAPPGSAQVVASMEVFQPQAAWLRLAFGDAVLSGDPAANGAVIRITSMTDGAVQYLNAESLRHWSHTSAYFNGPSVVVDLLAYGGTGDNRLVISSATVGEGGGDSGYGDRTLCGPTDDRWLSYEQGNARFMPAGCTAWIVNDTNRTFLTAGHCGVNGVGVVEFNVPLSNSNGSLVHPAPQYQFAVEGGSVQSSINGVGNDWSYFGTYPNSNTGLTAFQTQGHAYTLASSAPTGYWQQVRITGYGTVAYPISNIYDQVQRTHYGPYQSIDGMTVRYTVDTTGGNSGAPVFMTNTNTVIGIHTNAGCTSSGGYNQGTAIQNSSLQYALANPRGICRSGRGSPYGNIVIVGDLNNNFGAMPVEGGNFGLVSQLGPAMQGLAYDANNGRLLAIDSNRSLFSINPSDGGSQYLGTVYGTTLVINGLAYDSNSQTLFGIAQSQGQLFAINTGSMQAVAIGWPQGNNVGGIDYDRNTGTIYGLDDSQWGTRLVVINRFSGAQSVVGYLGSGITDCNGLAWNPNDGRLYTVNASTGMMLQIAPWSGVATQIGNTNGYFGSSFGMAARPGSTPPPGTCSADFDGDGDVGTDLDIQAFFAALGGGPGNADFDGDGDVGTDLDIQAFFRVLAGNPCIEVPGDGGGSGGGGSGG